MNFITGYILGIATIVGLQAFAFLGTWLLGKATSDVDYGDWENEMDNQNARLNAEK